MAAEDTVEVAAMGVVRVAVGELAAIAAAVVKVVALVAVAGMAAMGAEVVTAMESMGLTAHMTQLVTTAGNIHQYITDLQ